MVQILHNNGLSTLHRSIKT